MRTGKDGVLCTYAVDRGYLPTASVVVGAPLDSGIMAMSGDHALLALPYLPKPFFGSYIDNPAAAQVPSPARIPSWPFTPLNVFYTFYKKELLGNRISFLHNS